MSKNKLIKMATLVAGVGTIATGTAISISSCGDPGSTGQKAITATIEGTFKVGVAASPDAKIIVKGYNGVNLNKVDILILSAQELYFTKGTPSGNTLVFTITGTPIGTFNDNLNIDGSGVSCNVRLVIEPADPIPPSPTSLVIYGQNSIRDIAGEAHYESLFIFDNLGQPIGNAGVIAETGNIGITVSHYIDNEYRID
jgi:hypothetical protein